MVNPWRRLDLSPERAVLLALSVHPKAPSAIAHDVGLRLADVQAALQSLLHANLAIREGDAYELTGPLCWFGDFATALEHHARKNLLVAIAGEAESHLYLCDIRIKGSRPVGDPRTETVSVLGCGKTAHDVVRAPANGDAEPTCHDCKTARTAHAALA